MSLKIDIKQNSTIFSIAKIHLQLNFTFDFEKVFTINYLVLVINFLKVINNLIKTFSLSSSTCFLKVKKLIILFFLSFFTIIKNLK